MEMSDETGVIIDSFKPEAAANFLYIPVVDGVAQPEVPVDEGLPVPDQDWRTFHSESIRFLDLVGSQDTDRARTSLSIRLMRYCKSDTGFQQRSDIVVEVMDLTAVEAGAWRLLASAPLGSIVGFGNVEGATFFDLQEGRRIDIGDVSKLPLPKAKDPKTEIGAFATKLKTLFTMNKSMLGKGLGSNTVDRTITMVDRLVKSLTSKHHNHPPSEVFVSQMLTDPEHLDRLHFPLQESDIVVPMPLGELSLIQGDGDILNAADKGFMENLRMEDRTRSRKLLLDVIGIVTNDLFIPVKTQIILPDLQKHCEQMPVEMTCILGEGQLKLSESGRVSVHIPISCEIKEKVCGM